MRRQLIIALVVAVTCLVGASAARADPPTPLGGLDLQSYCQSLGYTGVTLKKGFILGEQAAYDNWRCYTGTPADTHSFSMEQACMWTYGPNAVQTHPLNADDAFTWVCYSTEHS